MAEIRIEQKRRSMAWLWILILLVIVAAVAWYVTRNRTVPGASMTPRNDSVVVPSAAPVPPATMDSVGLPMTEVSNRMRLVNA